MRYNQRSLVVGEGARSSMTASDVQVRIDDRVRLMGALLAASRYPDLAQARKKHAVHAYARATRKRVASLAGHPAVHNVNALLEEEFSLDLLFATTMVLDPVTLQLSPKAAAARPDGSMADDWLDFAQQAGLQDWWREEAEAWERSMEEAGRVLAGAALAPFLSLTFGPIKMPLAFMPNISYPADVELALPSVGAMMAVVPPRPAWGDSPPWPFDEDPAHLLRGAIVAFTNLLLWEVLGNQTLEFTSLIDDRLPVSHAFRTLYPYEMEQYVQVFGAGLVAIYLEDHISPQEAKAYLLMEKRMRGLDLLPAVVQVLREYHSRPKAGTPGAVKTLLLTFAPKVREAMG